MPRASDLAEEPACGEERRRQVLPQRPFPTLDVELPHRTVLGRPHAGHRRTDVDRAEQPARGVEQLLHLCLLRQIGCGDARGTDLRGERRGALGAPVVVDHDPRTLSREGSRARGADPPGPAGDEHALACKPGLHFRGHYRPEDQNVSSDARRLPSASKSRNRP